MSEPVRIDFRAIASAALTQAPTLLQRWLPSGHREGPEWVARNPTRSDGHFGSFKVNLRTGRWADFATRDSGGDLISLAAYLFSLNQRQAAEQLADALGIDPYER